MVEHWESCECRKCDQKRIADLRAEVERLRDVMKQILDCEDCPEKIGREALRQEGGAE